MNRLKKLILLLRSLIFRLKNIFFKWIKLRIVFSSLVILITSSVITYFMPTTSSFNFDQAIIGLQWQDADVIAPFDFPLKKESTIYIEEQKKVALNVPPVFVQNKKIIKKQRQQIDSFFIKLTPLFEHIRFDRNSKKAEYLAKLNQLKPSVNLEILNSIEQDYLSLLPLKKRVFEIYDSIYIKNFIDHKVESSNSKFLSLRKNPSNEYIEPAKNVLDNETIVNYIVDKTSILKNEGKTLVQEVLYYYCRPNYYLNDSLYEEDKRYAIGKILPYKGIVKKGEVIVRKNEIVTNDVIVKLKSLEKEKLATQEFDSVYFLIKWLGKLVIVVSLLSVTVFFLSANYKRILSNYKKFFLLILIYVFITALVIAVYNLEFQFSTSYNINLFYIVPICVGPIIINVFFNPQVGFISNVIIALLASLVNHNSFEIFIIQFIVGTIVVFYFSKISKRIQFIRTAFICFIGYCVVFCSYHFYMKGNINDIAYGNIFLFFLNVSFTLGTYPLISFIEKIFGITSELTLMEYLDTNHELLTKLKEKAPGTYQHSLQVANIAEEVAKEIGANALQVHAGALFHDIGKMELSEYFTENQKDGVNPHKKLNNNKESARIIIDHVPKGVKIAKENKLPRDIINFIKTHHGTSRVEYFYYKQIEEIPEDKYNSGLVESFRYPGPKPSTKEQVILMLSDSVEAASRSMDHPSKENIKKLVEKIMEKKISDGQFVNSNITFQELMDIKSKLIELLSNIYHSRIKYPDSEN